MTITIGGTSREFTEEQVKQIEVYANSLVGAGPWKPKIGDGYWCVNFDGQVSYTVDDGAAADRHIIAFGNCFQTKELAEAHAEGLRAFNNLWQLATAIGTSKEEGERWAYEWRTDGRIYPCVNTAFSRHSAWEFPSRIKCERFIREGQVWLDVLYPLTK